MNPSSISVTHTDQVQQDQLKQVAGHVTEATGHVHTTFDIQPPQDIHPLDAQTQAQLSSYDQTLSEDTDSISDVLPFFGPTIGASRAITFLKTKMGWLGKKHGGEVRLK